MKSIRAKLTVLMILICTVGMLLITAISVALTRQSLSGETLEKISQTTSGEAVSINSWLENQTAYITAMATELAYADDLTPAAMLPRLADHLADNGQYFDVYVGYPEGNSAFGSGYVPDYSGGWSAPKRPWYIGAVGDTSKPFITAPYTDSQTGGLCITVSKAIMKDRQVMGVAAIDILIDKLNDIVMATSVGEGSYAFLVDESGGILIHPNANYGPDSNDVFQHLDEIEGGAYRRILLDVRENGDFATVQGVDGVERYYTAHTIGTTGWRLFTAIPVSIVEAPIQSLFRISIAVLAAVLVAAFLLIFTVIQRIVVRPVGKVTAAAKTLTSGSTDIRIDYNGRDEIGSLVESFVTMAQSIRAQAEATRTIADGNLAVRVPIRSDEDVMGRALEDLCLHLNEFIAAISQATVSVTEGSARIAHSSQALSQGASEQSRAIENLSASIEQITESVRSSQQIIARNYDVSGDITSRAQSGAEKMTKMIEAVEEINKASSNIAGVIKVIDEIASQTNILALNAAVEAARASEHGKGFAVVAEEVRMLASHSASAARETTSLIENSITRAEEGMRIAQETGDALRYILGGVRESAELTDRINRFAQEQADVIRKINEDVALVAHVMNTNSTSSEENLAVAHRLQDASQRLSEMVRRFQLDEPYLASADSESALRPAKW